MNPSPLRTRAAASSFLRSASRPLRGAPRPSLLALLAAAALAAPGRAEAQAPEAGPSERALPVGAEAVPAVLTGRVLLPGGAPAPGAVVVSSAGGQAVTGERGEFRLEVAVPTAAERLQLTAVASLAGGAHVASVQIGPVSPHRSTDAGTLALEASSGCQPSWLPTFGIEPGTNGQVRALAVFDDGAGPALYAGGSFTTAGGAAANSVAKWDGSSWSPLASGLSGGGGLGAPVHALAVFDDGGGPALYAGGSFTAAGGVEAIRVAKWDGSSWSPLGSGLSGGGVLGVFVFALAVFDDGGGPALYAGGSFTAAGGVEASRVAKWDGSSWSPLGSGMDFGVQAMTVFDDGSGPALYAGGNFSTAGGVGALRVAKWNGTNWSPLGSGANGVVRTLAAFDDGSGPALYAGGTFTAVGGVPAQNVARWDGSSWSALGSGTGGGVHDFFVLDDGGGPALHVGGTFTTAGGVAANHVAKWGAAGWSPLGNGTEGDVYALGAFDDGGGPALYAAGDFTSAAGTVAKRVAKWDGADWSALGSGLDGHVHAVAVFDDGGGPALYAAGGFTSAGGVAANRIAKWNGSSWSPLGSGVGSPPPSSASVWTLTVFDDGGGPALYAGGHFITAGGVPAQSIARWDGSSWAPLGSGLELGFGSIATVFSLAVFDDGGGPALYAGGVFTVAGGVAANRIARWDGSSWSPLGGGVVGFVNAVHAMTVFDDGAGPALHVGGVISEVADATGSIGASNIAKWDGSGWSPVGGGTNAFVRALTVFDDGGGPALYAGGGFSTAGGLPASRVAKWDGSTWSSLGTGMLGDGTPTSGPVVRALSVFDDGAGPALYAGGAFTAAGGVAAQGIASWDGSSWSPLGSGVELPGAAAAAVLALAVFDDGGGPALFAGGGFGTAPDSGDSFLAKWGCPTFEPVPGCSGNPATLSAISSAAKIGQPLVLQLEAGAFPTGTALLFAGLDGTDAGGCGLLLPGFGELLLALAPVPILAAQDAMSGGIATLTTSVPAVPALVGVTVAFQAANLAALPGPPIELSSGIAVTFVP